MEAYATRNNPPRRGADRKGSFICRASNAVVGFVDPRNLSMVFESRARARVKREDGAGMKLHQTTSVQRIATAVAAATWMICFSVAAKPIAAQAPAAAGAVALKPYTAPDQSASAGVPSGWQVTKGEQTVIQMTGPQGEAIFLGNTM